MRIAFDAKRAAQNRTGLGNYSRFVLEGLCENFPENEYILYIPNERKSELLSRFKSCASCVFCYPKKKLWRKLSSLWRIFYIKEQIRKDAPDIFHGLSNEIPLSIKSVDGLKCIVTIHDLIFLRYPEYYPAIDRKIYEYKFRKACITADIVVAVSECTKRDIVKFFDINPEKIKVVYQGCDKSFQTKADESVSEEARTTYNLPKEYILYVGSIESRKNLMLIVKAMKHIKSDLPLVAVGKSTPYADKVKRYIKENGLSDKVRILHNVSFKHLPSVYQMSSLFIYPSFFEGFGIPILEALYSGVPVIAATGSCLEEAGGPSSIYVNPTDEQSLATAIDSVLTDDVLRNKMIKDGLYYAQRFDQKKLSEDMMKLYESLLK